MEGKERRAEMVTPAPLYALHETSKMLRQLSERLSLSGPSSHMSIKLTMSALDESHSRLRVRRWSGSWCLSWRFCFFWVVDSCSLEFRRECCEVELAREPGVDFDLEDGNGMILDWGREEGEEREFVCEWGCKWVCEWERDDEGVGRNGRRLLREDWGVDWDESTFFSRNTSREGLLENLDRFERRELLTMEL